jgi:DNA invertase Pin-like site-specific DNA recombinase
LLGGFFNRVTGAGGYAARMLGVLSYWERARGADRGRRGLAAAREKGALRPAIDPALKRRIERMRAMGMTLQAIADELNEAGVPTVRGGVTWRPSSVQAAIGYRRPVRR